MQLQLHRKEPPHHRPRSFTGDGNVRGSEEFRRKNHQTTGAGTTASTLRPTESTGCQRKMEHPAGFTRSTHLGPADILAAASPAEGTEGGLPVGFSTYPSTPVHKSAPWNYEMRSARAPYVSWRFLNASDMLPVMWKLGQFNTNVYKQINPDFIETSHLHA